MPSLTDKIIILNIVVFIFQIMFPKITDILALNPVTFFGGSYWQLITHMFLHGSVYHIFINMFVLYIFGIHVERALGKNNFLLLYFASGIGSALFYIFITWPHAVSMIGASGAVFGILTAYAFLFPKNILIIFPGIPMPAYILIIFLFIFEIFLGVTGLEPGIANFAHVGGIITSAIIMIFIKRSRRNRYYDFEFFWE